MAILWFIVGMMLGLIITSIVVACDWHEHPKRERAEWLYNPLPNSKGNMEVAYTCKDCFTSAHQPSNFCPCCGAKMTKIDWALEEGKRSNG